MKLSPRERNILCLLGILGVVFVAARTSIALVETNPAPVPVFEPAQAAYPMDHSPEPLPGDSSSEVFPSGESGTQPVQPRVAIEQVYPTGKLLGSAQRETYEGESMSLLIPKLEVDCLIQDGTDEELLKKSPGLYEYAQMPGLTNANVSIAGHRDIHGAHFYALDKLGAGDFCYLIYDRQIYQYQYRSSGIYTAGDWSPIESTEDGRLTLTTCDPIGTSLNRLIVTAQLVGIYPYSDDFTFTP